MSGSISQAEALAIAHKECERIDIPWRAPYSITEGRRWWRIYTPSNQKGGNATILVSKKTGEAKTRYYDR